MLALRTRHAQSTMSKMIMLHKAQPILTQSRQFHFMMAASQRSAPAFQIQSRAFSTVQKSGDASAEKVVENGFYRLTKHYKERQAMEKAIGDIELDMTFNHLPYGIRFFMFLNRIKFRIFVLVSLGTLFNYWGNLLGIASSRLERVFKKYKKRWIYKYNRTAMTYQTALETRYEPERMSRHSTDKLS